MRILLSSYAFRPSIGGIESVSAILADQFVNAGQRVELVTETPGMDAGSRYLITRRPSFQKLFRLLQWADVFLQNNISLRSLWLALLLRKPTVVVHQTWIRSAGGKRQWNDLIKHRSLGRVTNVAISRAIAADIKANCVVIPNPYRDELFRTIEGAARSQTLIFVGRLVSDKGVDLLLRALVSLKAQGLRPDLTIVGEGPEKPALLSLTQELELEEQVRFTGPKDGMALVQLLNEHRIMVIPSRWAEPFGVVALEGIACGCVAVGSEGGGLGETIDPCGLTFPNGDVQALAEALLRVLSNAEFEKSLRAAGPKHLEQFKARVIAARYLHLLENLQR